MATTRVATTPRRRHSHPTTRGGRRIKTRHPRIISGEREARVARRVRRATPSGDPGGSPTCGESAQDTPPGPQPETGAGLDTRKDFYCSHIYYRIRKALYVRRRARTPRGVLTYRLPYVHDGERPTWRLAFTNITFLLAYSHLVSSTLHAPSEARGSRRSPLLSRCLAR